MKKVLISVWSFSHSTFDPKVHSSDCFDTLVELSCEIILSAPRFLLCKNMQKVSVFTTPSFSYLWEYFGWPASHPTIRGESLCNSTLEETNEGV